MSAAEPGYKVPSKRFHIILGVFLGVLVGSAGVWVYRRNRKLTAAAPQRRNDVELGSIPSQPQQRGESPTNRYDGSGDDGTLPAYQHKGSDETPSLFQLSYSITRLKDVEREPATSPFHLLFFERVLKLQKTIKDVQFMLETAPPEGYNPQFKEGRKLAESKKQMLELVGTPGQIPDTQGSTSESGAHFNMYSILPSHSSLHERLVQLHSLLTLVSTITSTSSADFGSTFTAVNTSVEALLSSLETVPIPSNIGQDETTDIADLDRKGQPSPPAFEAHPQSISRSGDKLPVYRFT